MVVSDDVFLAGYGAAQAVSGPLFTFAAYLGTVVSPEPQVLPGAALGLVGIFLPGDPGPPRLPCRSGTLSGSALARRP